MDNAIWVAIIAAAPTIVTIIATSRKERSLACYIDVLILRYIMIDIHEKCERKGYRTKFDNSIFYEIYKVYTKKLKQNSYICKELEPSFQRIGVKG